MGVVIVSGLLASTTGPGMDAVLTGPHTAAAVGGALVLFLLGVIAAGVWR